MKKGCIFNKTKLKCDTKISRGQSIEEMIRQATLTGEPIKDTMPVVYTDRKDGVLPQYDPRTDRWEYAQRAMDYVSKSRVAQRENAAKPTAAKETEV